MTKPLLASGPAGARQLAADLRKPMPKDFIFDFDELLASYADDPDFFSVRYGVSCTYVGCAMGYAQLFYSNIDYATCLASHFGMNDEDESSIFYGRDYPPDVEEITPEMVADALDTWADRQEQEETLR